jgi:hypothetical protein
MYKMQKRKLQGFAVLLALAISVVASSSAFAADEWLLNGNPITSPVASELPAEMTLEDTRAGIPIKCSFTFVGTVGPGANGTVTVVLSLTKTSPPISCVSADCSLSLVEVTPVNLPWATKIALTGPLLWNNFLNAVKKIFGFEWTCNVLGINLTDECTGLAGADLTNVTGGVEGIFTKGEEPINPNSTCTLSKEKTGTIEGGGITKPLTGTLTVS